MNTKCTLANGSIYIYIISITKERIHRGQEPTLDYIILSPTLSREEIDTSTCEAQICAQEKKGCLNNIIKNIIK